MAKLMEMLPHYYQDDEYVNSLQDTIQSELMIFTNDIIDLENQFFVETATWGLDFWERLLEINTPQAVSYSLESRRENILSKIRGRGTSTVEVIRSVAQAYTTGSVDVEERPSDYSFFIKFINFDFSNSLNIDKLYNILDEIKPAHLVYDVTFTERNIINLNTEFRSISEQYIQCGEYGVELNLKNKERIDL